ncbi:MAG: 3-phosphoglycerate dehydrogenase family protein [Acidobacteriota bacterium]|jgi:D-3-phosphoglycerate dehydrogenase
MQILIADKFPSTGIRRLVEAGCEVASNPDLADETLVAALGEHQPEVLIVRSTKVTEEMLRTDSLALVIRAGAGVNTIDVPAASRLGIFVANCPGKNAVAVAELTMGLLIALDRKIPDNVIDLRAGRWDKKTYSKAAGLKGRTLGLIGLGSIGREVALRARAFGMRVIAWSRSLTEEAAAELGVSRAASPQHVAESSDVVSIHLAQTAETQGVIDRGFFQAMRPGAFFINTSRGGIVDQDALVQAMEARGIRAGLDVYAQEPGAGDDTFEPPIGRSPNLYGTHHIGASTEQAQQAIADETVRILETYLRTGEVLNCVNLARRTPARAVLTVRHRDRVGVLAHVLGEIRKAEINVQEMENVIFEGAEAACAHLHLDREPEAALLESIRAGNEDIFSLSTAGVKQDT